MRRHREVGTQGQLLEIRDFSVEGPILCDRSRPEFFLSQHHCIFMSNSMLQGAVLHAAEC